MAVKIQSLGEQVAWACRILALEGYADLTLGHVSARDPDSDTAYIKRKSLALDEVGAGGRPGRSVGSAGGSNAGAGCSHAICGAYPRQSATDVTGGCAAYASHKVFQPACRRLLAGLDTEGSKNGLRCRDAVR